MNATMVMVLALLPADIRVEEAPKGDDTVELKVKLNLKKPEDRKVALRAFAAMFRQMSRSSVDVQSDKMTVPPGKGENGKVAVADLMDASPEGRFIRDLEVSMKDPPESPEKASEREAGTAWVPWRWVIAALLALFAAGIGIGFLMCCTFFGKRIRDSRSLAEATARRERKAELDRREASLDAEALRRAEGMFDQLRLRLEGERTRLETLDRAQQERGRQLRNEEQQLAETERELEQGRRELVNGQVALSRQRKEVEPLAAHAARLDVLLLQLSAWSMFIGSQGETEALTGIRELLDQLTSGATPVAE